MSELHDDIERRFAGRLRNDVEVGVRPFDPRAIMTAATVSPGQGASGRSQAVLAVTVAAAAALTVVGLQALNQHEPSIGVAPTGSVVASGIMSASPSVTPLPTSTAVPTTAVDASGILIIGPGEQVQARPPNEPFALAFNDFIDLVMAHPDDLGYSWIDPASEEMVLSVVSETGRALIESQAAEMDFRYRIREVEHSYAELQRIADDATRLVPAGVPDADLIYMLYPDERDNRIVIVISEWSRPLVDALAERFDPDALAVLVDPSRRGAGTGG